jgi:hypothetical protein
MAIGVTAGGIGIGLFMNGWDGLAPHPLVGGGMIAAIIGIVWDR